VKKRYRCPLDGITAEARVEREKNLHLNVFAEWFRMIYSGEKTEDYREMSAFWHKRLVGKNYETVTVRNGFDTFAPEMRFAFAGYEIGEGRPEWGAPGTKTVFIVRFGARLSEANIEPPKKV